MPSTATQSKRLSCDRCRAQKLRCPRPDGLENQTCSRCLRRGVQCIYSSPLPKGRPRTRLIMHNQAAVDIPPASQASNQATEFEDTSAFTSCDEDPGSSTDEDHNEEFDGDPADLNLTYLDSAARGHKGVATSNIHSQGQSNRTWVPVQPLLTQVSQKFHQPGFKSGQPLPLTRFTQYPIASDYSPSKAFNGGNTADLPKSSRSCVRTLSSSRIQDLLTDGSLPPVPTGSRQQTDHEWVSETAKDYGTITGIPRQNPSSRHLEEGFWALIPDQQPVCDDLAEAMYNCNHPEQPKYTFRDKGTLNTLLQDLPTKDACDNLVYCFAIAVQPMSLLINIGEFRNDYNTFWHRREHHALQESSVTSSFDDPAFVPLLLAVLYCGAIAAPASMWHEVKALATHDSRHLIEQLYANHISGLKLCQHSKSPSLNSLAASLLGQGCKRGPSDALNDLAYVNQIVRIAQSLGLHRRHGDVNANKATRIRRRHIWWHVLWLDAQYALRYGSKTRCGAEGDQWDVEMTNECAGDDGQLLQSKFPPILSSPISVKPSTFLNFATGRHMTAQFMHELLNRVNGCHRLTEHDLGHYMSSYKSLHSTVTALINKMPAQGLPEKGFVPFRVINASLLTHEALYSDQSEEPAAFISWARITLTMLLKGSLLGLWRVLLNYPNLMPQQQLWQSISRLGIDIIRHLIQIVRVPAFEPYFWFLNTDILTSQAILIVLSYLSYNPSSPDSATARYFVDEALEILERLESRKPSSISNGSEMLTPPEEAQKQSATILRVLQSLRTKIDSFKSCPQISGSTEVSDYLTQNMNDAHQSKIPRLTSNHVANTSGRFERATSVPRLSMFNNQVAPSSVSRTSFSSVKDSGHSMKPDNDMSRFENNRIRQDNSGGYLDIRSNFLDFDSWYSTVMPGTEDMMYTGNVGPLV